MTLCQENDSVNKKVHWTSERPQVTGQYNSPGQEQYTYSDQLLFLLPYYTEHHNTTTLAVVLNWH